MMTCLRASDLRFEAENLRAVFAHGTVHRRFAGQDLACPVCECFQDLAVIIEISRLDEFDFGKSLGRHVGKTVDAVDQDSAEQKIGKHHDPAEAEHRNSFQAGLHQWKCYAGVSCFRPAEAKPFPQQPCDFRDVGVGVRIRGSASDDNKASLRNRQFSVRRIRCLDSRRDSIGSRGDHLWVHPELAPVKNFHVVFQRI